MKLIVALAVLALSLGTGACSSPTEEAAPEAPGTAETGAPTAREAGEPPVDQGAGDLQAASKQAVEAAEKACRGCPNPTVCEQALGIALRVTTAALQSATSGTDRLAERAAETDALTKRFDMLSDLSNECQAEKQS